MKQLIWVMTIVLVMCLGSVVFVCAADDCMSPDYWQRAPIIPEHISDAMKEVYQNGIAAGNDPQRLLILGDCQSVPSVFLGPYDEAGKYNLGEYAGLQGMIDNFAGSFTSKGLTRQGGLNIAGVLTPSRSDPTICEKDETPLACDLRVYKPSIVLVSLEEWWNGRPVSFYETYLNTVLEMIIDAGAVPILGTKADNYEGGNQINQVVGKTACAYDIPLWNFWRACQSLPGHGVWTDGFHLTVGTFDFSDPNQLTQGRTMRNLTALQVIDFVWRELNNTL